MANTYDIGDLVHLTSAFTRTDTGAPLDPSTVALVVLAPDQTETTYTYPASITKDSTGDYHVDIAVALSGTYRYRWTSTGTGQASQESWFQVRQRKVS